MIATRVITRKDLQRAADVNDAIALEFGTSKQGAEIIGEQLGIDVKGAVMMGAEHAKRRVPLGISRNDAIEAVTHSFTMGVVVGLRAVEVVGRE